MSVTVAIKNSCSTIGEGPHWNPKTQCLLYVDINAGDVHSWDSTTDVDTKVHLSKYITSVYNVNWGHCFLNLF